MEGGTGRGSACGGRLPPPRLPSLRLPPPASDATPLTTPTPPTCIAPHRALPYACSNNSLTGVLDPSLGRGWPLMDDLQLDTNRLRGTIPASFATMGRLRTLYLS